MFPCESIVKILRISFDTLIQICVPLQVNGSSGTGKHMVSLVHCGAADG